MSFGSPGRVGMLASFEVGQQGYSLSANRERLIRQEVTAAQERLERLGYPDRAVRLLVVLQDRDQPAGGRQGAVEGGGHLRLAAAVPVADAEAAGLGGGAGGAGGDLAGPDRESGV